MFTFLNFIKKSFTIQASKPLTQFYQQSAINSTQWVSLAINKNSIAGSFLTKELDLLTESDFFSLKMAETNEGILHQIWRNQQSICKSNIERNSPLLLEFNLLINKLIEAEIHYFQNQLNQSQVDKIFSPNEVSQEEKALEWLRVSFQVLEKAVIESLTNPEYLFQTLLFFGINPKTKTHEIRIITFNLDIKFELHNNGSLRVKIYNDKSGELGSNKKTDLEGDFNFRKREMLDELTKLFSVLSPGIKWS
ncbi:MAG: hypothetical protein H7281_11030 [Bacteriovorax sp.]|nr:hypothetical protein [Bacteriovorax sp.]